MVCKLCGGKTKRIELLCSNLKILGASFPESEVYISSCEKCGLIQYDMEATQEDLLKYYVSNSCTPYRYIDNYGEQGANDYFSHLLCAIEKYITYDSFILDVGGSWGEFADFMMKKGYKNFYVADPSEQCVDLILRNGGNAVKTDSTIMCEDQFPCKFDVIFYNHTMEHILDLDHTMLNTLNLLKDNGILFIDVPNVEKYVEANMEPYYFLTYEHVLHFSGNDLDNISRKYGMTRLDQIKYYNKLSHYPSCYALFMKSDKNGEVVYSNSSEKSMKDYLEYSYKKLEKATEKFRNTGEPLILWGIGASTTQLLQGFEGCNVVQLLDKNKLRQNIEYIISGKKLAIQDPEQVLNGATIVILPYAYAESIQKQIYNMGIKNKVVSLCF